MHVIINENLDFDLEVVKHSSISFFFSRVPTAGIEIMVGKNYHCLARKMDNFFVGNGKFSTPLRVRLTAITGEQVETTIKSIKNDVNFSSGVQFKGIKSGSE